MSGFVYIWYDRKHKRYYIGSHWGTEDDGYICSSRWMRKSYRRRPEDFKRRIITRITTSRYELFEKEEQYLSLIKDEELGKRYYNLKKTAKHWSSDEEKSKSVGQKISTKRKGIPLSEEARKNVRKGLIDSYAAGRKGGMNGKFHSEETKQKMRKKRRPHSEETKEKMRKKQLEYYANGGKSGRLGKPQSPKQKETLQKLHIDEEFKKKASERMKITRATIFKGSSFYGRNHTEETKIIMKQKALEREASRRMINIKNNITEI